jgi:putative membrane protein
VVDLALRSELAHFCIHFVMVVAAVIMWWPVLSPLPEAPALVPPMQMMYLFLQSLVPTIPASFLTFGEQPIYKIYATFPRIWPNVSVMADQRAAGLIMKLVGGAILWVFITVIFFRWYFAEQKEQGVEEALRLQESAT